MGAQAVSFGDRLQAKWHRQLARHLDRDLRPLTGSMPVISFTFDDAPQSAFERGGDIVRAEGGSATYYCSLGLLGAQTEVGRMASLQHLQRAIHQGHELGCHTYDHLDGWRTAQETFMHSIEKNALAFKTLLGVEPPLHFAYPKSGARWPLKRAVSRRFVTCRGGAESLNAKVADLHLLKACFLDQRAGWPLDDLRALIDLNRRQCGWLIFATHDVDPKPTAFGCTPQRLKEVVQHAAQSGALLCTMTQACQAMNLIDVTGAGGRN